MTKNKLPVILLLVIIAVLLFNAPRSSNFPKGIFSIISTNTINFAGVLWDTEVNNHHFAGSCSGSVSGGEIANLQIQVSGSSGGAASDVKAITQTPINNYDEMLVVFDSNQYSGFEMGSSAGIFLTDNTRISTRDETNVIRRILVYEDSVSGGKSSFSNFFDLKYVGFRNNHDGTYSIVRGNGLGDLTVTSKVIVPNTNLFLGMHTIAGGGAGGDRATATMNSYNVIFRVSGFALCKANQYSVDLNRDGKFDFGECINSTVLELNHREEFEQSVNDRLFQAEQQNIQKIADLQQQISILQQQNGSITLLSQQLEETQKILINLQSRDKNVIATVQSQEQFIPESKTKTSEKTSFNFASVPSGVKIILGIALIVFLLRL